MTDISIERPKNGPLALMLAPGGGKAGRVNGMVCASDVGAGAGGGIETRKSYAAKSVIAAAL
jgi:hypothetical protein